MHITIVYRYFYPDTSPYAIMLRSMATWFVEAGHSVKIITAQPSYKSDIKIHKQPWFQILGGIEVQRVRLLPEGDNKFAKLMNSFYFPLRAAIALLGNKKSDVMWTATMPPIWQAMVVGTIAKLRGSSFIYHYQDIYPEIATLTGMMSSTSLISVLRRLDIYNCSLAARVVVLSSDMKTSLLERGVDQKIIEVINNFPLVKGYPSSAPRPKSGGTKRFVFAGNLGRFQNLEKLVRAFAQVDPNLAQLEFLGSGRNKNILQDLAEKLGERNIRFHPHVDATLAQKFVSDSDYGIVSLIPGLYRFAFPSKTFQMMQVGKPIFAIVEETSELAQLIMRNRLGVVVDPNNSVESVAQKIEFSCQENFGTEIELSARARIFYDPDIIKNSWIELLNTIGQERV